MINLKKEIEWRDERRNKDEKKTWYFGKICTDVVKMLLPIGKYSLLLKDKYWTYISLRLVVSLFDP